MKGKIVQDAKLYFQKEGEEKIRHIKTWEAFEAVCRDLGITTAYNERTFLGVLPPIGRPIMEWPEKEVKVGPERLFFCVHPDCDFQEIKDTGATLVCTYMWDPRNEGQQFLDKAQEQELRVLFDIKSQIHDQLRHGKPWIRQECEYVVNRFNDNPALYGYYLLDEPDAGDEDPKVKVSIQLQREIHSAFRRWTKKPLVIALRGGTVGWHLIDFSLWDIITNTYAWDGTGKCWGMQPLDALKLVGTQERAFMDEHDVNFLGFMFQSSSHPATQRKPPLYGTKVPLGQIENQFNVLNGYGLFPELVGMYAWNGGDFDPARSPELRQEIKALFDKIK